MGNASIGVLRQKHIPGVSCSCSEAGPDSECGAGCYLFKKLSHVNSVIEAKGFVSLYQRTKDDIHAQYQEWRNKYLAHVGEAPCLNADANPPT